MLLAKWHRRALLRAKSLSTMRGDIIFKPDVYVPPTIPSQWSSWSSDDCTRIVCMSDTHGKHRDIAFMPQGDILIHTGDFTKYGEPSSVHDLSAYFQLQREQNGFKEVLCIAGNHDMTFHKDYYEKRAWMRYIHSFDSCETKQALQNCTYLEDSSTTLRQDGNIVAYGSPWTPNFFQWAFNLSRGEALREVWSQIPNSTDILLTHGPPEGRGDLTLHSGHFGCADLLGEVQNRVKPRLHVYGHIHEGYGTCFDGHTLYVNASSLDMSYEATNPCIVVDVPHDQSKPAVVSQPQCGLKDTRDFLDWLKENNYLVLAEVMERVQPQDLPLSNDLLRGASAYQTICAKLRLRTKHHVARRELRTALCQLYAESF